MVLFGCQSLNANIIHYCNDDPVATLLQRLADIKTVDFIGSAFISRLWRFPKKGRAVFSFLSSAPTSKGY
jgi:hypothetical protein